MQILPIIYRLAIAFWAGGAALFTFVLTPIIFKANDRDTAGKIVGTLFPGYFKWGLACGIVALASLLLIRGKNFTLILVVLILMLSLPPFRPFPSNRGLRQSRRKYHPLSPLQRSIPSDVSSQGSMQSPLSAT